ncbi:hypothetical protein GSY71_02270 [Pusillimonas sp. TS35]|uniref:hypothetical protein n=1 Tax=Paracandidimonas lactea TaxID=2895524 RepID=UPI001370F3F3|nr:hypothetical protein [Paracandidimonas lactea]MYN11978.1 hypothetical protein [Pusillimonas sp. TS35]
MQRDWLCLPNARWRAAAGIAAVLCPAISPHAYAGLNDGQVEASRAVVIAPAVANAFARVEALAGRAFDWQAPLSLVANGVAFHIRSFTASMGLEAAAQVLARHDTLFQRLLATPGLVRLSGLANGSHWLVEIQPHSDGQPGVSGRLSVMALPGGLRSAHAPAIVSVPAIGSHPDLSWLPAGAVPLFAHTDTAVANRGGRYGFRVDMQADALAAGIAARLVTLGWTAQHEAPALRRVQMWRRGPVQMLIFLWGRGDGTALYVHFH